MAAKKKAATPKPTQEAVDQAAHDLSASVLVEEAAKQTAAHMDALYAQIPKGGLTAENGFTYASQARPCLVCGNAVVPGRVCAVDGNLSK